LEPLCGAVGTPETIVDGYCGQCQTTTCAHCRGRADRRFLAGNLCAACRRLEVQCRCPRCRAVVKFPSENQGLEAACPECQAPLVVPEFHRPPLSPGQTAPAGGTYRCRRCGPDGEGAGIVRDHDGGGSQKSGDSLGGMMKAILGPLVIGEARRVAAMPLALKSFAQGATLPECPNGCGPKTHWAHVNPAAEGALLVGEAGAVQTVIVEAGNREAALQEAARLGIAQSRMIAAELTRKEAAGTVEVRDSTLEGALEKSKTALPAGGVAVGEPKPRQQPGCGVVEASASDESEARSKLLMLRPAGATLSGLTLGRKPVRLGFLLRKGTWTAQWSLDCVLELNYRVSGQYTIRALQD
jgi:hypothetical protein